MITLAETARNIRLIVILYLIFKQTWSPARNRNCAQHSANRNFIFDF